MTKPVFPLLPPDAGDPGSVSAAAGTLHRMATVLAADAEATRTAYRVLVDEVRLPSDHRRAADTLVADAEAVAAALEEASRALQDYATEVAELAARLGRLLRRVGDEGWRLDGSRVVPGYGISGRADPGLEASGAEGRAQLQEALDDVGTLLARRRDLLGAALAATRPALDRVRDRPGAPGRG